jgi:hypothetical protein
VTPASGLALLNSVQTVRWCREAVQLTRVVHYLSCFDVHRDTLNLRPQEPDRPSPRLKRLFGPPLLSLGQPRLTSKTVWTLKKPKLCGLKGSTLC